jgi:hypothetical protein
LIEVTGMPRRPSPVAVDDDLERRGAVKLDEPMRRQRVEQRLRAAEEVRLRNHRVADSKQLAIKEALYDTLGVGDVAWSQQLGIASYALILLVVPFVSSPHGRGRRDKRREK